MAMTAWCQRSSKPKRMAVKPAASAIRVRMLGIMWLKDKSLNRLLAGVLFLGEVAMIEP